MKRDVKKLNKGLVIGGVIASLIVVVNFFVFMIFTDEYTGYYSWDRLNNLGEHNLNLKSDPIYIDINNYLNIRYNEVAEELDGMHESGLITDDIYNYMKDGLQSEYFENSMLIEYEQYQKDTDTFIEICNHIRNIDYGHSHDEEHMCYEGCKFQQYLDQYIPKEKQGEFVDAHKKYHEVIEEQYENLGLSDGELKYFYESFVASDLDNIEEIEVKLTYLTAKNLEMNDKLMNWYVRSSIGNILNNHKTITLENKEALKYLNLSIDAGLYDTSIITEVANILYNVSNEIEGAEQTGFSVIDITGIEDYESYIEKQKEKQQTATNVRKTKRVIPVTITGRIEGEQVCVLYEITKCSHKQDIMSYEDYIRSDKFYKTLLGMLESDLWGELYNDVVSEQNGAE